MSCDNAFFSVINISQHTFTYKVKYFLFLKIKCVTKSIITHLQSVILAFEKKKKGPALGLSAGH